MSWLCSTIYICVSSTWKRTCLILYLHWMFPFFIYIHLSGWCLLLQSHLKIWRFLTFQQEKENLPFIIIIFFSSTCIHALPRADVSQMHCICTTQKLYEVVNLWVNVVHLLLVIDKSIQHLSYSLLKGSQILLLIMLTRETIFCFWWPLLKSNTKTFV